MQIAFWSDYHGQTCTTSNTIAVATYIAINYKLRVLLTHNQYCKSNMENAFLTGHESDNLINFDDIGIDALEKLVRAGQLRSEDVPCYTKSLIDNRLEMLTGRTSPVQSSDEDVIFMNMLKYVNNVYDIVFIDLNSGLTNEKSKKILESSDIIVFNLNQNEKILTGFFCNNDLQCLVKEKKSILLIGRYDEISKCSLKYIKKTYKYTEDIYSIPYNTNFMDSMNNHDALNFFLLNSGKNSTKDLFNMELERLSKRILKMVNIDCDSFYDPVQKLNVTNQILSLLKRA